MNPAVRPFDLLQDFLGDNENPYTHQKYRLAPHHMDELLALRIPTITSPILFGCFNKLEMKYLIIVKRFHILALVSKQ